MKAILIDDEYANSELLSYEIQRLDLGVEIVGMYEDPVKGLQAIKNTKPDLVFLDIEMPRINGFELLDLLGEDHRCQIIFVTAYNEYAVNAFEYYAVDYLVKPVEIERLSQAIKKSKLQARNLTDSEVEELSTMVRQQVTLPKKIVVPISNGFQMITISDIIRCEADNNYTTMVLIDEAPLLVSKSLIHFDKLLRAANFVRVHQSHLVNMEHVDQYIKSDGGHLVMCDRSSVPVSRSQKHIVNDYFKSRSI